MKDRIPRQNGKNNIIKTAVIPENTSLAELIQMLNAGLYADVMPNNATSGDNIGVDEVGTPLNKASILKDATATNLKQHGFLLSDNLSEITVNDILNQIGDNHINNFTLFKLEAKNSLGQIMQGVTLTLTSPYAPATTTYVTNNKGILWLLLPNTGSYTVSRPDLFAYNNAVKTLTFSGDGSSLSKTIDLSPMFQFLTSGTETITTSQTGLIIPPGIETFDICAAGGGGAGGGSGSSFSGGGGGSGYMTKVYNIPNNGPIDIIIGAGGIGVANNNGGAGGSTSVKINDVTVASANGGNGGVRGGAGGSGGSGGGGGIYNKSGNVGGAGGSDGSDGSASIGTWSTGQNASQPGGNGDGVDKNAFDDVLYCGGGGGGGAGASGGAGGGGTGGSGTAKGGDATLCGSGGGGAGWSSSLAGGNGSAGMVQFRWEA